jgi:hypothetical protein
VYLFKDGFQMEQIPVLSESGAWDEDAQCPSCAICDNDFSAMRRRHHCRVRSAALPLIWRLTTPPTFLESIINQIFPVCVTLFALCVALCSRNVVKLFARTVLRGDCPSLPSPAGLVVCATRVTTGQHDLLCRCAACPFIPQNLRCCLHLRAWET